MIQSDDDEEEESNSDDYEDVEDDEDSENGQVYDIPKPSDMLPEGDSIFEINRKFLEKISQQKSDNPNGWQKLFEDFKECMGRENNAFKAWTLCQ